MDDKEKLGALVLHEIEQDEDSEPYELGCILSEAHEKEPALLDDMLIALCGWKYDSLVEMLAEK